MVRRGAPERIPGKWTVGRGVRRTTPPFANRIGWPGNQPLPFSEPDRFVALWPGHFISSAERVAAGLFPLLRDRGVQPRWDGALSGDGDPLQLKGARTSINLFFTLGAVGVRALTGLVFGVSVVDPLMHVVRTGAILGVVIAACWLPARRAASVDPMLVLRGD